MREVYKCKNKSKTHLRNAVFAQEFNDTFMLPCDVGIERTQVF